jgi:phosphoserine aminotransferase
MVGKFREEYMPEERVFNFAAGPSQLPLEVLQKAGSEITDYHGTGMSVMEMSHRSKMFQEIFLDTKNRFRRLMHVPENYEILFLQGGGSSEFSMVPLNLMARTGKADYAITGHFSEVAAKEAEKYGSVSIVCSTADTGHNRIPAQEELHLDPEASYFHYCANNTIYGTEWQYVPDTGSVPLVSDMSSEITSRRVDISKYGIIYAGAQKNVGPAGVTIVIIRRDLAGNALPITPLMMNYQTLIAKDSMYNTPPCWCIYMVGLVLEWLESQGGVEAMEQKKHQKAELLYKVLDDSHLFHCHALPGSRSDMNVTFRTGNDDLDSKFVAEAAEHGLVNLKGHRLVKGMRASIYNAMPMEGVERLAEFIQKFDAEN